MDRDQLEKAEQAIQDLRAFLEDDTQSALSAGDYKIACRDAGLDHTSLTTADMIRSLATELDRYRQALAKTIPYSRNADDSYRCLPCGGTVNEHADGCEWVEARQTVAQPEDTP